MLEHAGLLPSFAFVHGATLDGAVRHKDQVVAAALAANPHGRRPVLVGDRAHDVLGAAAHGRPHRCGLGTAPVRELTPVPRSWSDTPRGAGRGRRPLSAENRWCRRDTRQAPWRGSTEGHSRETPTEQQVRRSFVNCSRGEARPALPKLRHPDWTDLDVLGWRDPRRRCAATLLPRRRTTSSESPFEPPRVGCRPHGGMCLLCQTAQSGDAVSLFTARRTGEAGRNGNTVGTYICADLGCSIRVRTEIPPWLQDRNPDEVVGERATDCRSGCRLSWTRCAAVDGCA